MWSQTVGHDQVIFTFHHLQRLFMSRLSIIPAGYFQILLSLFFSAVTDMLISLKGEIFPSLGFTNITMCCSSYFSTLQIPLLSLDGWTTPGLCPQPFSLHLFSPSVLWLSMSWTSTSISPASDLIHDSLSTQNETNFLLCLKRKSFTALTAFFTLSFTLIPLLIIHIMFFFFSHLLEHMLPPAIRTLFCMVPIVERLFFQHSHGCIFSNIPISSLSRVPQLKCSQQTHFT